MSPYETKLYFNRRLLACLPHPFIHHYRHDARAMAVLVVYDQRFWRRWFLSNSPQPQRFPPTLRPTSVRHLVEPTHEAYPYVRHILPFIHGGHIMLSDVPCGGIVKAEAFAEGGSRRRKRFDERDSFLSFLRT